MDRNSFILCLLGLCGNFVIAQKTYKAAVVEFEPYYEEGATPRDVMRANALKIDEYAAKASKEGAILIALPEYGITTLETYGSTTIPTRDDFLSVLTDVPDPEKVVWNPCFNPDAHSDRAPEELRNATFDGTKYKDEATLENITNQVMHIISCSARNHSIAILVNLMSREVCNKETDRHCPADGRYQYNTNIVFDRNGTLISRYHKTHLFQEIFLDTPIQAEYSIFEIDSIKFASFICFDMIYNDPAVQLVTEKGIKNIIFSTAWVSEMPFMLAPQLYSRWARGLGVNVMATNYYKPSIARIGSGTYSSQLGAINQVFDISGNGSLIIAELPADPSPVPQNPSECINFDTKPKPESIQNNSSSYKRYILTDEPSTNNVQPIHKIYYQPLSNFSISYLTKPEDNITLCNGNACCNLKYNLNLNNDSAFYALLAYDGIRPFSIYDLGEQSCAVMRCEASDDIETCGRVRDNKENVALFDELELTAELSNDIVLPSVLQVDLQLKPSSEWKFSQRKCSSGKVQSIVEFLKTDKPQVSVSVVSINARMYDRDSTRDDA